MKDLARRTAVFFSGIEVPGVLGYEVRGTQEAPEFVLETGVMPGLVLPGDRVAVEIIYADGRRKEFEGEVDSITQEKRRGEKVYKTDIRVCAGHHS